MVNSSYIGVREDVLALVPQGQHHRVLDLGCATGSTGRVLKELHPEARVTGIEYDPELARDAKIHLDRVLVGDALEQLQQLVCAGELFDLVICADVLEHLVDPWTALKLVRAACPEGSVIVSLPNVAHISTLLALCLDSRWPYRDRGIHDRTHLRFFGKGNLNEFFGSAGFRETRRTVNRRIIERPHSLNERLAPLLSRIPVVRRLTEYQFVSLLK